MNDIRDEIDKHINSMLDEGDIPTKIYMEASVYDNILRGNKGLDFAHIVNIGFYRSCKILRNSKITGVNIK